MQRRKGDNGHLNERFVRRYSWIVESQQQRECCTSNTPDSSYVAAVHAFESHLAAPLEVRSSVHVPLAEIHAIEGVLLLRPPAAVVGKLRPRDFNRLGYRTTSPPALLMTRGARGVSTPAIVRVGTPCDSVEQGSCSGSCLGRSPWIVVVISQVQVARFLSLLLLLLFLLQR